MPSRNVVIHRAQHIAMLDCRGCTLRRPRGNHIYENCSSVLPRNSTETPQTKSHCETTPWFRSHTIPAPNLPSPCSQHRTKKKKNNARHGPTRTRDAYPWRCRRTKDPSANSAPWFRAHAQLPGINNSIHAHCSAVPQQQASTPHGVQWNDVQGLQTPPKKKKATKSH